MYLCVSGINFVSFYYLFLFDFGNNLKKYGEKKDTGGKKIRKKYGKQKYGEKRNEPTV
jgi:hypothetical protein